MIIKDAFRSLKDDFERSFFYWLTILLTSMFVFLYFNILCSNPQGLSILESGEDLLATGVTIAVIIICFVAVMFANDFFAKRKAKELAVRMICGATALQLAEYLLIQTLFLLIIALPVGIALAYLLLPVLNSVLTGMLQSELTVTIHSAGIMYTTVILGFEVFWILMLNLSFSLRTGAALMFNSDVLTKSSEAPIFRFDSVPEVVRQIMALALFIGPIFLMYLNHNTIILDAILSIIGFVMCVEKVFVPFIDKYNSRHPDKQNTLVWLGFLRSDLQMMKANFALFIFCICLLATALLTKKTSGMEVMLYSLAFCVMSFLLALAVMFKYTTELSTRQRYYRSMKQIGYVDKDLLKINHREVLSFYLFDLLITLLYLTNIFIASLPLGQLTFALGMLLGLSAIIPLVICFIVVFIYYKRVTFLNLDQREAQ